ncbi:Hsp20/alpha crystallin family protein [Metabacillus malikii]|uniref:HSP20 family molecular chaperone IbpA n=1 Tax=Metabacillus malikii TaxID=1504265 RepID=A0ABT9ZDB5_9BACI|nr:Hsp20/alpha crystallin family protein [Metabacillus malikii]MDQ0229924.1 HSP20 family molecular chaperone IbpA [Metabacillus malikii]
MNKKKNPLSINGIEEWMEQFFIDPFTTLLDEQTFRIDLFETNDEYIIEAEVGDIPKEDIQIETKAEKVTIYIEQNSTDNDKQLETGNCKRTIILPYQIDNNKINATLSNGLLEVRISKHHYVTNQTKSIWIEIEK